MFHLLRRTPKKANSPLRPTFTKGRHPNITLLIYNIHCKNGSVLCTPKPCHTIRCAQHTGIQSTQLLGVLCTPNFGVLYQVNILVLLSTPIAVDGLFWCALATPKQVCYFGVLSSTPITIGALFWCAVGHTKITHLFWCAE